MEAKRRYRDPYTVVAGDFNQWNVAETLEDYPDLREAPVGPTRHDWSLERIFLSLRQEDILLESGTLPTLESDDSSI